MKVRKKKVKMLKRALHELGSENPFLVNFLAFSSLTSGIVYWESVRRIIYMAEMMVPKKCPWYKRLLFWFGKEYKLDDLIVTACIAFDNGHAYEIAEMDIVTLTGEIYLASPNLNR